jgi:HK97 gp10 family phage protein
MLGKDLKRTANKNILSKPKGGKVYIARTRGGRRRRHRSSAPGESHANRSGMLRRSLGWKVNGSKSMEFGYGVDKPAPDYGKFVEDGTFKMKPRPSLAIAVKQTNRNSELYVGQMFEKLTR